MAQSLITFAAAIALASVPFASADCNSYGVDFQEGGTYFQNNASSDPFTAFQYFQGCTNDTANNVLVDPQGNQVQCSPTNMQPDKQTQLITCNGTAKDTLYSGDWSILVISNNGNADPIAYQRDFSLDVGAQSTTYVYPTVTTTAPATIVETSTKQTQTTITSTLPASTVTSIHTYSSEVAASAQHGWTHYPHPSYIKSTKTLTTYTHTATEYAVSATTHQVPAQCTVPVSEPSQDKGAQILPSVLGELDNVAKKIIQGVDKTVDDLVGGLGLRDESAAAAAYKKAIAEGRQPSEHEKHGFIAEREARAIRRGLVQKRHPDNKTVTSTATQISTISVSGFVQATMTDYITSTQTAYTTISTGAATVYQNQTVPSTSTAPVPTYTWTVYQPFAFTTTTVYSTIAITNTQTTTAHGAAASCAHQNKYMH